MTIEKQYERFRSRLINDIIFIATHKVPDGWLPFDAAVMVDMDGYTMLVHCRVKDILDGGECNGITLATWEEEPYGLVEFRTEDLIDLLRRYCLLSTQQGVWRDNALAYMEAHTKYSKPEIVRLVDAHWNPEFILYDNLDALTIPY